jgi:hypothetical protein
LIISISVTDYLQTSYFESPFTSGDFIEVSQERSKKPQQEKADAVEKPMDRGGEEESLYILLSCPNEGCVKMYQRHSALEKHLFFWKMPNGSRERDSSRQGENNVSSETSGGG